MKSVIIDGILHGSISEQMSKVTPDMSEKKEKLAKFDEEVKCALTDDQYQMVKKLYDLISEYNLIECEHYFKEGMKIGLKLGLNLNE